MSRHVPIAEAKAKLSAIVDEVLHHGQRVVIERHGKPVAALVPIDELARLEEQRSASEPRGFLALAGLFDDLLTEEEIEQYIADVNSAREQDIGRDIHLKS